MKVSQGQYRDIKFSAYYQAYSGPKGCYIYNKVQTPVQAKAEAEFAVTALNGREMPMGVWLDMEDSSMRALGKTALTSIIEVEAAVLKNAGYNVGIYCNKDWYVNVLDSKTLSQLFPFWIARYPASDNGTMKESLSPKDYNNCVMWQYSSKGKVPGISGNVDMDVMFDGTDTKTVDELAAEVLQGVWGNGATRRQRLLNAGYDYKAIQAKVNSLLKK